MTTSSLEPDDLAQALSKSADWPTSAGPVEWIQTHISHVFLVGDRVFKLRKAVRFSFLDFGTTALRNADCLNELSLNRRLSPDVYLGVAPLIPTEGTELSVRVGAIGESIMDPEAEHVVVMRRLPQGIDAHSLLNAGTLAPQHMASTATRVEAFHATQGLGTPAPWSAEAWRERVAEPIRTSLDAIASSGTVPANRVQTLVTNVEARIENLAPRLERRRLEGRAVDGHGDLHLEHIWFENEAVPLIIDCLEFDEDLRRIDCASEVAFLAMDLAYRGRNDLAEWFLASYAMASDDYGLFDVVDFYASYRALVRAKVAALASLEESIPADQRAHARESVEKHLDLAETLLTPRATGRLIVFCGTVGSGKSSVVRHKAQHGSGIPIVSDRVRKSLAGLAATARTEAAADEGLYRRENTEAVYRALLERAEPVLESGRNALLDASFTTRAHREAARAWARERGISVALVEVCCDPEVARRRLAERQRQGEDPSDAGPDFLDISLERFEPPDEWPEASHEIVRTDDPDWRVTTR